MHAGEVIIRQIPYAKLIDAAGRFRNYAEKLTRGIFVRSAGFQIVH